MPDTDVLTESHGGSLFTVRPVSTKAQHWLAESLTGENFWMNGHLVVEHGYIVDLIHGMVDDGLVVRDRRTNLIAHR